MDAGAGGFADGEQAGEAGAAVEVGEDAAHQVVGGGRDRDRLAGGVDAGGAAAGQDGREAALQVAAGMPVASSQQVPGPGRGHAGGDGPGDDVAGGQVAEGVDAGHDRRPVVVAEHRALAAHGLG